MKLYILTLLFLFNSAVSAEGFKDEEVFSLYQDYMADGQLSNQEANELIYAAQTPYAPLKSHAGAKFLEALAWYNDMTLGNKNGKFSLEELNKAFEQQLRKYLTIMLQNMPATERIAAWKMLQKLEILKQEILASGKSYFPYRAKTLSQVDFNSDWNSKNTILSRADFNKRVLDASWEKPVLVKFGLTYCVHCLLMENLASVPAVAKKYADELTVFKLWWNPNDQRNFYELNQVAGEQGITSSPMFNLYVNGKLVKSGYAFPDEEGNGLEEFLSDVL
jgi:thiol-disulfide isomerase/thioredoxin